MPTTYDFLKNRMLPSPTDLGLTLEVIFADQQGCDTRKWMGNELVSKGGRRTPFQRQGCATGGTTLKMRGIGGEHAP